MRSERACRPRISWLRPPRVTSTPNPKRALSWSRPTIRTARGRNHEDDNWHQRCHQIAGSGLAEPPAGLEVLLGHPERSHAPGIDAGADLWNEVQRRRLRLHAEELPH